MIKILIVDDHPIVRRGLKQVIVEEHDMEVVAEAENAQEAFAFVRKSNCDVVILDISMPGMSGLDVLRQLRYEYPKLPVLILSVHSEEQYALRVIKAGASGYLTKDSAPDALVKAIRKVASGGKYVSPYLAERLVCDLEASEKPLHEKLTVREFQILCMIASGKPVKEIAGELCLSAKTVSTYRIRTLQKMQMKSNAELVGYAVKNKLIE
ncbi:MAG TPA: response regulator transcription factor [Syntrophobacteraceae bacterium]|nr:response regulator transcription factor [Syntrophobacteraceae bacterium]